MRAGGWRAPAVSRCGPWRTQTADDTDVARSANNPRGSANKQLRCEAHKNAAVYGQWQPESEFYRTGSEDKTPRLFNDPCEWGFFLFKLTEAASVH